jgi:hypothetical protein
MFGISGKVMIKNCALLYEFNCTISMLFVILKAALQTVAKRRQRSIAAR